MEGFSAAGGGLHAIASALEPSGEDVAVGLVVIDDEDAARFGRRGRLEVGGLAEQGWWSQVGSRVADGGCSGRAGGAGVGHLVDEVEQAASSVLDFLEVVGKRRQALLLGVFLEHLAVADDLVERRTQFVAEALLRDLRRRGRFPGHGRERGTTCGVTSPVLTSRFRHDDTLVPSTFPGREAS
jgi:hypothetical protein